MGSLGVCCRLFEQIAEIGGRYARALPVSLPAVAVARLKFPIPTNDCLLEKPWNRRNQPIPANGGTAWVVS
jgi:hypothetical protein